MGVYFWRHELEPAFPLRLLENGRSSNDQIDGALSSRRIPGDSALTGQAWPVLVELKASAEGTDLADPYMLDANLRRFLGLVITHRGDAASPPDLVSGNQHKLGVVLAGDQRAPPEDDHPRAGGRGRPPQRVASAPPISRTPRSWAPKEYVTKLPLTEAKRLLLETDLNICELAPRSATRTSTSSASYFHCCIPMSPDGYRRHYRNT